MRALLKKIIVCTLLVLTVSAASFAQQITKFAVVDTARVYQAYFRNSAPVRNYESKKEEFVAKENTHLSLSLLSMP